MLAAGAGPGGRGGNERRKNQRHAWGKKPLIPSRGAGGGAGDGAGGRRRRRHSGNRPPRQRVPVTPGPPTGVAEATGGPAARGGEGG